LEKVDGESTGGEFFFEADGVALCAAKDEAAIFVLVFEIFFDELSLFTTGSDGEAVIDVAVDDVGLVDAQCLDVGRHAAFDEFVECFWEGCGEEPGADAVLGHVEDLGEIVFESHAEHFICLVEDEALDGGDAERAAPDHVEQATGRGDDDLSRSLQGGSLAVDVLPATDDFDEDSGGVLGVAEELFGDLLGELAGGCDDEALNFLELWIDFGEERQAEGGCLAGAGLGLSDKISATFHQERDGFLLDGRGLEDFEFFKSEDEVGRDSEFCEWMRHGSGSYSSIRGRLPAVCLVGLFPCVLDVFDAQPLVAGLGVVDRETELQDEALEFEEFLAFGSRDVGFCSGAAQQLLVGISARAVVKDGHVFDLGCFSLSAIDDSGVAIDFASGDEFLDGAESGGAVEEVFVDLDEPVHVQLRNHGSTFPAFLIIGRDAIERRDFGCECPVAELIDACWAVKCSIIVFF
jgi:hypothetical protein